MAVDLPGWPIEDEELRRGRMRMHFLQLCRGCGKRLDPANLEIADGCPCNSPRGVNHGLVLPETCTCPECDRDGTGSARLERA